MFGTATKDDGAVNLTGPDNTHTRLQCRSVFRVKFAGKVSKELTKGRGKRPDAGVHHATAQDRFPERMD
jgi:hypothetical protein